MSYSCIIRKNLEYIHEKGYEIYPNGSQIFKVFDDFGVLITDLTGDRLPFCRTYAYNVLIKKMGEDIIVVNRICTKSIFCPRLHSIEKKIIRFIS